MKNATVRVGSREIAVEQEPLPTGRGLHFKFILSQPEHGQLRLLPGLGVRMVGWFLCGLGWPLLLLGLFGFFKQFVMIAQDRLELMDVVTILVLFAFGVPLSFFGVMLRYPRYRFDKVVGQLTIQHFLRAQRRKLKDIVAIQVIDEECHGSEDPYLNYQLNLILDDEKEPRLFVAYNIDLADMGQKAKRLADFLEVPLLTATQTNSPQDRTGGESDPTRHWPKWNEPLPPFDLEAGALGSLKMGDGFEKAEFLGRPDRVEQTSATLVYFDYAGRGFDLVFQPVQFFMLRCAIQPNSNVPPKPGQGFCRPQLSNGIKLTPDTTDAQVQQFFGTPRNIENYSHNKILNYAHGRLYMEFEFEQPTEKLLSWTVYIEE